MYELIYISYCESVASIYLIITESQNLKISRKEQKTKQ